MIAARTVSVRSRKVSLSANIGLPLTLAGAVGCRLSTWNDDEVNEKIPFFRQLPALHESARSFPVDRRFPDLAP